MEGEKKLSIVVQKKRGNDNDSNNCATAVEMI